MQNNYDVIAILHRFYSEGKRKRGGFDKVLDSLSEAGKTILVIEHPLTGLKEGRNLTDKTVISQKNKIDFNEISEHNLSSKNVIVRWCNEFLFNVFFILKNVKNRPVLMVADPLNGATGVCLKWKFSKMYYHCIDFSEKRFGNSILNFIYAKILVASLNSFDIIGVVSDRIKNKISFNDKILKKIINVPNSLEFFEVEKEKNLKNIIVCTGGAVIKKYNYDDILTILSEVKKSFHDVFLYAVGGLDEDPEYVAHLKEKIEELGLQKNIKFTGFGLRETILYPIYKKSKIGLSFYSKESSYYTYFGDSQKIREYALFGIPTIADGNSATDDEMLEAGAGFVVKDNTEAISKIKKLLSNKNLYEKMSKAGIEWARKTDKKKVISELINKLWKKENMS